MKMDLPQSSPATPREKAHYGGTKCKTLLEELTLMLTSRIPIMIKFMAFLSKLKLNNQALL